ncbi:rhomboid-like protein [Pseudoscourfieldia marina]
MAESPPSSSAAAAAAAAAPSSSMSSSSFTPPYTRLSLLYSALLLSSSLLMLVLPGVRSYLGLVPAKVLPYATTIITTAYCDASVVSAILSGALICTLARMVEPVMGTVEIAKTIAIANVGGAIVTWLWLVFTFAVTQRTDLLYSNVTGAHAAIAALFVALKQVNAKAVGAVPSTIAPYVPYMPAALLLLTALVSSVATNLLPTGLPSNALGGTIAAWVYLRYFRQPPAPTEALGAPGASPYQPVPGDASEEFAVASCVPPAFQAALTPFDRFTDRIFGGGSYASGAAGSLAAGMPSAAPLPGNDSEDARRRRERGARALEERLAQAAAAKQSASASAV